jgi:hypothetical protein
MATQARREMTQEQTSSNEDDGLTQLLETAMPEGEPTGCIHCSYLGTAIYKLCADCFAKWLEENG